MKIDLPHQIVREFPKLFAVTLKLLFLIAIFVFSNYAEAKSEPSIVAEEITQVILSFEKPKTTVPFITVNQAKFSSIDQSDDCFDCSINRFVYSLDTSVHSISFKKLLNELFLSNENRGIAHLN